jgi:hypothetical protein
VNLIDHVLAWQVDVMEEESAQMVQTRQIVVSVTVTIVPVSITVILLYFTWGYFLLISHRLVCELKPYTKLCHERFFQRCIQKCLLSECYILGTCVSPISIESLLV